MTEHPLPSLSLVGAGSLGQAFAALIAASGQPVTLLATPTTAARLREAGRIRLGGAVDLEIPAGSAPAPAGTVGVTADPARLPAGAGALFATKGHQLAGAIQAVRAHWPPPGDAAGWVGGLQNGLVKDDWLAGAFGVSVLTRTSAPRMFRDPDLIRAYLSLVRETAAIAAAHGVTLGDYTSFPIRTFLARGDEETVAALSAPAPGSDPAATGAHL